MFEVLMQLVVTTCATFLPFQGSANIWRVLQAKVYVTVILPFEGSHLFGFFIHSPLTCWLTGWLDDWLVGCLDACLAGTATGWLRHSLGNWQVHSLPFSEFRGVTDRQRATEGPQKIHGLFITFPHCRRCSYGTELVFSSVDLWHYAQIHIEWVVYTMQHKNRRTGPRNKTEAGWPDI